MHHPERARTSMVQRHEAPGPLGRGEHVIPTEEVEIHKIAGMEVEIRASEYVAKVGAADERTDRKYTLVRTPVAGWSAAARLLDERMVPEVLAMHGMRPRT